MLFFVCFIVIDCCGIVVKLLQDCCENAVLFLWDCCGIVALLLWDYSGIPVAWLWVLLWYCCFLFAVGLLYVVLLWHCRGIVVGLP